MGEITEEMEFNFEHTDISDIDVELKKLNAKKSTTFNNIPAKILKETSDISAPYITSILNASFDNVAFPQNLKLADVLPIYLRQKTLL